MVTLPLMFSEPTFIIHISGSMESPNGKEKKGRLNQLEDGIKEQVCFVILVLIIVIAVTVIVLNIVIAITVIVLIIVIVVLLFIIVLSLNFSQYSS